MVGRQPVLALHEPLRVVSLVPTCLMSTSRNMTSMGIHFIYPFPAWCRSLDLCTSAVADHPQSLVITVPTPFRACLPHAIQRKSCLDDELLMWYD